MQVTSLPESTSADTETSPICKFISGRHTVGDFIIEWTGTVLL